MRGLTQLERLVLVRRAVNAPVYFVDSGTPEYAAVHALFKRGLLSLINKNTYHESSITDAGRLALRVCPVEVS